MSAWKKVGDWLSNNADEGAVLVGSLLTGNIVGAVAAGADIVKNATGAKTPEKALERLKEDPATMIKLKELAMQEDENIRSHLRQLKELEQKETALHLTDVSDARKRETSVAISEFAPIFAKIIQPILACTVVVMAFVLFACLIFVDITPEAKDIVIYILGALTTAVAQVLSYYFDSSKSSSDKNAMINLKH